MKIFINYRRDDTAGYAGRLFDHLAEHFGERNVFMDIDTIEPGQDFRKVVQNAVGTCDVVLVMMGKHWSSIGDAQGRRRLEDPRDWVRVEIASALANPRVLVIPVLVRGAEMPSTNDLPEALKELAWRNAIELSDQRFQYDANKLIEVIERAGLKSGKLPIGRVRKAATTPLWGFLAGALGIGLLLWLLGPGRALLPFAQPSTPTSPPAATNTLAVMLATSVSTPTVAPTETLLPSATSSPTPSVSAVQVLEQYFQHINKAGIPADIGNAWQLMTANLQNNPSDRGSQEHYQNYWWQLKVQYELYDCGGNTVAAKLYYFNRNQSGPLPGATPRFVTYELIDENGALKLNRASEAQGISSSCEFRAAGP